MSEKEWTDETALKELLSYLTKTYFNNDNQVELSNKWIETLMSNLYFSIEHFKEMNAEEWVALKIPLRVRSLIRKIINFEEGSGGGSGPNSAQASTEDLRGSSSNFSSRRRKSRTITAQTVKKTTSNSSVLPPTTPNKNDPSHRSLTSIFNHDNSNNNHNTHSNPLSASASFVTKQKTGFEIGGYKTASTSSLPPLSSSQEAKFAEKTKSLGEFDIQRTEDIQLDDLTSAARALSEGHLLTSLSDVPSLTFNPVQTHQHHYIESTNSDNTNDSNDNHSEISEHDYDTNKDLSDLSKSDSAPFSDNIILTEIIDNNNEKNDNDNNNDNNENNNNESNDTNENNNKEENENNLKKKRRMKKLEKGDDNIGEDLDKKSRTKRTTSQPKISKIDPSKLMLDIKNLSSSDYLFEKSSSKKESDRDASLALSPSSDLKSPDEKSKKKSEGKEGKEGKSHRRKGSRQESSRSRTLDRSSEKSAEKLPIKIEKLNMEKLNSNHNNNIGKSASNVFKRPPSADRNFIHAIEKSSSEKTSARLTDSPQFDTSTFDTFDDSLQSLEKMDKASFSKSLPKGLLRSKSSKFQKIMTDSFWKDPFHSSSNSPSSSSSNNNSSSNNLASTSSHSIASMAKDEIYRDDDNSNSKVKKGYKGVVTVGGDISVSTKLLNYFSFYSKSQFFSNKEKILEVSVYDEQVECTFENGSRGTAEDCLEKDVIILTFSIIDPASLNNLLLTYMPLLKKRGYPKHLVYLVGIEADKRDVKDRRHVSIEQTEQVLKNLRGLTYCEIGRLDTKASVDNLQMLVMNCARLILCNLKSKENKFNKWVSKFGGIQKMISLQEAEADINLRKCRLEVIPVQLLFLRSFITKLRLSSNLFKFFPIEVLLIEGLQELDLSNNQISIIPNNINKLSKLTSLNLESNKLEILPLSSLQEITTLQEIKLKGNPLSQMPRSTINRKKSGLLSSYDEINAIDQSILLPPSSPSNTLCISPSSGTSPAPLTAKSKLSLLFSVEIEKILDEDRKLSPHIQIPIFVQRTVNFIITSGMDKQGIFRMEGNVKSMQDLRDSFDSGIYIDYMKFEDVNNVTSLLKFWLRSLPTPLLPNATSLLALYDEIDPFSSITSLDLFNQIVQSSERSSNVLVKEKNDNGEDSDDDDDDEEGLKKDREKIEKLKNFLAQIPRPIYRVCFTIFRLCNLINRNSENNKMDEGNLSKVIATNLVNLPENENSNNMITNITKIQNIVTFLISFYSSFFLPSPSAIFDNDFLSEFETPFASVIYKLSAKHKSITTMNICNTSMGKRLWVADDAGIISIWDINDVEMIFLVCTLECNKRVNCLLAVDDKMWVGCIDAVHIMRGTDGDLIHTIDHPGYNFEVTSKKSNIWSFLQSNVSQIKIFDTKKMKIIKEFQIQSRVISIVKIKKEIWIACHNRIIYVYSIKGRELIKEITTEHQDRVTSLCIVGKNEVWSSANDGIHVFDTNTKELKEKIKTTSEIMGLMWAKDQVWAYSWDASIFVYNATTKEYVGKMKSYHNQPISTVISNYSPSSPNYWNSFSASYDHTIVVWQCRPLPSAPIKDDK